MKSVFVRFIREDAGQDLIEYALLASAIAVLGLATAPTLVSALNAKWTEIAGKLAPA
jgi:Flp pilus assembly pilin Flp